MIDILENYASKAEAVKKRPNAASDLRASPTYSEDALSFQQDMIGVSAFRKLTREIEAEAYASGEVGEA